MRSVLVMQMGARRNYVAARQLEAAGMLSALVTDAAWVAGDESLLRRAAERVGLGRRGLARRTVAGVARERVISSYWPTLAGGLKRVVDAERAYALIDEVFARVHGPHVLDGVRVVVSTQGNGGALLDAARARGALIVTDFVVTPQYLEIVRDEYARWPDWHERPPSLAAIGRYRARIGALLALSDIYLCPSAAVARDLACVPGFVAGRARVVPYGVSGRVMPACDVRPTAGRVLFAGEGGLRKGMPYLAAAATALKARMPGVEVVVAGAVSRRVRELRATRDVTFAGVLDAGAMAAEFARADVFCLPSLAEGSAVAIFEALAHGVPVVTTAASGSVVTNGVDGLIVAERDSAGIAEAVGSIVADRARRAAMSAAALTTAERYSEAACGAAFVALIAGLTGEGLRREF